MPITVQEAEQAKSRAELLYSEQQVEAALARMAQEISARLKDRNPLVVCVMTGGLIAAARLVMRLDFPLQIDYLHATRYAGNTQGGRLKWLVKPSHALANREILLIDDILDEGVTLSALVKHCKDAGARAAYSAVLIERQRERKNGLRADFVGLTVPDRYVFGYGMDYKEYWRNLPGIYAAQEKK
jgi:hypoxanthine phosphoribosyltransferase